MDTIPQGKIRRYQFDGGITFSPLSVEHAAEIAVLSGHCFSVVWSEKDFQTFLSHPAKVAWGAFETSSSSIVAYLICLLAAGELDIVTIATSPLWRRKGLAHALLQKMLDADEVERASLEVDASNFAAVELYKGLGFTIQGIRKKYYQGKTDALRMTWQK